MMELKVISTTTEGSGDFSLVAYLKFISVPDIGSLIGLDEHTVYKVYQHIYTESKDSFDLSASGYYPAIVVTKLP